MRCTGKVLMRGGNYAYLSEKGECDTGDGNQNRIEGATGKGGEEAGDAAGKAEQVWGTGEKGGNRYGAKVDLVS